MPRYLVEQSGVDDYLATRSVQSLAEIYADVEVIWLHSFVSDNRELDFCLCEAPNPEAIRKAARRAGLHVDAIHRVSVLDPHAHLREIPFGTQRCDG